MGRVEYHTKLMQSSPISHADHIRLLLRDGPQTARYLAERLAISQPTLSRALTMLEPELVRIGAARSIQYALRDGSRSALDAPIYRVDTAGRVGALGRLVAVRAEGFVMQQTDGKALHSEGLPWWLYDMRPQGYLGRAFCRNHGGALALPENLAFWGDSHVLQALQQHGADLAGNLLVGERAFQQFMNSGPLEAIAAADRPAHYGALAAAAARGEVAGSSAAGEQPKFTAFAEPGSGEDAAHVIVKFSELQNSPVSERWRDLLLAEHLALEVLRANGIAAAQTRIIDHAGQRFLQVQRFDRVGPLGRRALHSLAALDAEFVGSAGRWPDLAQALGQIKCIDAAAVQGAALLWAYGYLIGNTDMHAGNLSFMAENGRPYALAPAYDMTPMAFAPLSGGGLPQSLAEPVIAAQVPAAVWQQALPLAQAFVTQLQARTDFSASFAPCIAALQVHVQTAAQRIERLA